VKLSTAFYLFFCGIFFFGYSFVWMLVLTPSQKQVVKSVAAATHSSINSTEQVQSAIPSIEPTPVVLPDSHLLSVIPRKQAFNLSCEFAAAAGIIHYFTNDAQFAPLNEITAEKTLLSKVEVSKNPNVGVRMGNGELLKNLNQRFGGTEYYGVHAPPFLALFQDYGLSSRPIFRNNAISSIQNALYKGNLVMAWIKIGSGAPIDTSLSYGTTKIIPGEHSIIITGYDQNGVLAMDPGSGSTRHISYSVLLEASESFVMPFLEVTKSVAGTNNMLYGFPIDPVTDLNRENIRIKVINASGVVGRGNQIATIFSEFGYTVISIEKGIDERTGLSVYIRKEAEDYKGLIMRDFSLLNVRPGIESFENDMYDILVVVGLD
jgi:uncharacterized protein YvpB